jgi:hypothetical protein
MVFVGNNGYSPDVPGEPFHREVVWERRPDCIADRFEMHPMELNCDSIAITANATSIVCLHNRTPNCAAAGLQEKNDLLVLPHLIVR